MKSLSLMAGCLVLALSMVALSGTVAADQVTLDAFDFLIESYSADEGDMLTVTWNSDLDVMFTAVDTEGNLLVSTTDTSFSDQFEAPSAGTFVLTWMNTAFTTNDLNYNVVLVPFGELVDAGLDLLWIIIIIGVAVVAVVVVIVVLVVVYKPRHAQHAQMPPQAYPPPVYMQQAPPPGAPQGAPVVTSCMNCGSPADPQFAFCQRCGARLR
ncbi:MAG: zinc ribbon domain-containing protein [Thermoplasmata archaeon]|jgi:hypothetical protein|nr:zinc ribbon domain-containing protein [Thermoplasmata archaeon]